MTTGAGGIAWDRSRLWPENDAKMDAAAVVLEGIELLVASERQKHGEEGPCATKQISETAYQTGS